MFPNHSIVSAITEDRIREADSARLARSGAEKSQPKPRRARRLRALATRIAFTTLR